MTNDKTTTKAERSQHEIFMEQEITISDAQALLTAIRHIWGRPELSDLTCEMFDGLDTLLKQGEANNYAYRDKVSIDANSIKKAA